MLNQLSVDSRHPLRLLRCSVGPVVGFPFHPLKVKLTLSRSDNGKPRHGVAISLYLRRDLIQPGQPFPSPRPMPNQRLLPGAQLAFSLTLFLLLLRGTGGGGRGGGGPLFFPLFGGGGGREW